MAARAGAITIDFMHDDVYERIQELTFGRGADACIDAVGTEPHTSASFDSMLDRAKVATFLGTDRLHVLRQAIHNTRNFGVVSTIGVYGDSSTRSRWAVPSTASLRSAPDHRLLPPS